MKEKILFIFLTLVCVFNLHLFAGSSGKITGTIMDAETGEPLPFANVIIDGSTMGAAADLEGVFVILNVPPGVYSVTSSIVGFTRQTITDVRVKSDFTTRLEFELSSGSIDLEAVIIQGERNPLIDIDKTNPTVSLTSESIQELPVTQISELIRLQAGVAVGNNGALHFRGGYSNEVAYMLNGVTLNDPYGNTSAVGLATNAVQEVSVSVGTFSAEYGNALSGNVNYITKEGGSDYTFSIRGFGGDYVSSRDKLFSNIDDIDPLNRTRMEGTFGGPLPFLKDVSIFASGVYENFKGLITATRLYNTTDSHIDKSSLPTDDPRKTGNLSEYFFNPYDPNSQGLPTGDKKIVPLDDRTNISIQGNIAYRISPTLKVKYEFVLNDNESQGGGNIGTFSGRFNPDGRGRNFSEAYYNAFDFTHTVSQYAFYTLKGSHSVNKGKHYLYKSPTDRRYLPSRYRSSLSPTAFITGGTDNFRSDRTTTAIGVKGDVVAQLFKSHEMKAGFELRTFELDVESYSVQVGKFVPGTQTFADLNEADLFGDQSNIVRRIPTDTSLYTNYVRKPTQFAAYIRDKIELAKSMILNAGIRYEYFDPNAIYNPNISEEFRIEKFGTLVKNAKDAEKQHLISPRLSVSYPITDKGIIRFSYGHFYQNASLASLYRNPNFFAKLNADPVFGNPNVKPQKSVQYELGLEQGLTDDLRLVVSGYYKDVTNYIQTQTVFTLTGSQFDALTNLSYANTRGVTISLFKRRSNTSNFQTSLDYTFQVAEGNRTEPSADLFFSETTGKAAEIYLVPLSFDRPHIINATVNLFEPNDWTFGMTGYIQAGTPYTPALPPSLVPITFEQRSGSRPVQWNVDIKFEKFFEFGPLKYSLFLQVDNLFDTEREIAVYASSGRALTAVEETTNANTFRTIRSRIERGDEGLFGIDQIDNYYIRPDRVGRPREVRLGFSVIFN